MKTTPIRGVLNPPARPAPAATANTSSGFRPRNRPGQRLRRAWATAAPTCTSGPSRPRGNRARLARLHRESRSTVGVAPSNWAPCSGSSTQATVWGMPDPFPRAKAPFCISRSKGITTRGARARPLARGVQPAELKAGSWRSSRSCQWSTRFRGQQARPTNTPRRTREKSCPIVTIALTSFRPPGPGPWRHLEPSSAGRGGWIGGDSHCLPG